jgi:hypothetical protein
MIEVPRVSFSGDSFQLCLGCAQAIQLCGHKDRKSQKFAYISCGGKIERFINRLENTPYCVSSNRPVT